MPISTFMIPSNLIINADDFGINQNVNTAIVKSFIGGLINSTSVMVNMPGFSNAILLAEQNGFQDQIGLHVCLTQGKPISDLVGTPLVNSDGGFNKKYMYRPDILVNSSIRKAIKKEINSQLNLLKDKNIDPTHINTHHDIHELPWLLPIFLEMSKNNQIPLRISQTWKSGNNLSKSLYRKVVNAIYKFNNLNFSDYFEVLQTISNKHWQTEKKTEIMVHPDFDDSGNIIDSFDGLDLVKNISNLLEKQKDAAPNF